MFFRSRLPISAQALQESTGMAYNIIAPAGTSADFGCHLNIPPAVETKFWEKVDVDSSPPERIDIFTAWPLDLDNKTAENYMGTISISNNFGLSLHNVQPQDDGNYRCGISQSNGHEIFDKITHLSVQSEF